MSTVEPPRTPANNVRKLRTQLGLLKPELAKRAGVSMHSIHGIENRRRNLGFAVRGRLIGALSVASEATGGPRLSFQDVFPNETEAQAALTTSASDADETIAAADSVQFFALIQGPFGNPPVMTIRGFSGSPQGACGMPVFNTPAFPFTPVGGACSGFPICKVN